MTHKVITHIDHPEEWKITDGYNSHRPLLYLATQKISGVIVEAGMGYGSTALLVGTGRTIKHYETSKDWADKFKDIAKEITMVDYWLTDDLLPSEMGILFIDCAPGELRKDLLYKYRDKASVILVHDTEPMAQSIYGMVSFLNIFEYRLDFYPDIVPGTTALSNKIDVTKWI